MSRMPRLQRAALVPPKLWQAALTTLAFAVATGCAASPPGAAARPAAASTAKPAWGGPVSAPNDEQTVRALLRAAALGRPADARASCGRFVVAMPALLRGLLSMDPGLDRAGLQRVADVDTPDGRRRVPILIFAGDDALLRLLGSRAFAGLARRLAGGYIRPASELERKLVYQLVGGFEQDAKVTVAQTGALRVAFLLDHGHVFWMEVLSAWQPSEWASLSPRPLLARTP